MIRYTKYEFTEVFGMGTKNAWLFLFKFLSYLIDNLFKKAYCIFPTVYSFCHLYVKVYNSNIYANFYEISLFVELM